MSISLQRQLASATDYAAWRACAIALDRRDQRDIWREDGQSSLYDQRLLRRDLRRFEEYWDAPQELAQSLETSLLRNEADLTAPGLYNRTRTGETKVLVDTYFEVVCEAIAHLATTPESALPREALLEALERAVRNFGRPCLMMSGGATWGLYHVGVAQALSGAGLLPEVLCGSSMGAIVAAGIGTRTPVEMDALLGNLSDIHRSPLRRFGLRDMIRKRALMNPEQLETHIRANVGDYTFAEAFARSGRALSISVSPTRARQKPRILNYMTAPNVLVWSATVASCAVPGLFPAVPLTCRTADGAQRVLAPDDLWIDGSLHGDLPKARVGRLHNVNKFIVSQTNPHVLPFLKNKSKSGPTRFGLEVAGTLARAQTRAILSLARRKVRWDAVRPAIDIAHALADQDYEGDVNLHPQLEPVMYGRVLTNVSLAQLEAFALGGARGTWHHLPRIRNIMRVGRALEAAVARVAG